jgi:hypothetical protein
MYAMVSVLVPTRQRLARLRVLLDSFYETSDLTHAEIVFRVDYDDQATIDFLLSESQRILIGPRLRGYDSMPVFFNELAKSAIGDVLLCGNDDMVFRTTGWPRLILNAAKSYTDGLFDLGVSTHNETHYPFSIVSKAVVECLGYLWDPTIFWGDIFLRDVMARFNRCVMVPYVRIDHVWAGFDPDPVFLEGTRNPERRNPRYWDEVHAPAVERAVAKLQALRQEAYV